jgi:hypothetical protein
MTVSHSVTSIFALEFEIYYNGGKNRGNDGGPNGIILEQVLEELRDWEQQLAYADIDWDALDDPLVDESDHNPNNSIDLGI